MEELKVFSQGVDTYIAKSVEDVMILFKERTWDDYIEDGYGEADDWYECDPERVGSIYFEDEQMVFPENFKVLERREGFVRAEAKYKDWALFNGRGFLCSTEFYFFGADLKRRTACGTDGETHRE